MCGFAGWMWSSGGTPAGVNEVTARMAAAIAHRGPDSDGLISAPFMRAAFKRLSIVDLSTGDQPCANDAGDVQVFMNGEIYNHVELQAVLEARGHRIRGHSDTAVIPHLYDEYGDEFTEHLNGMFAICICDHRRRRVLLVRDRLGIKPLYYAKAIKGGIVFGSELKALLAGGQVEREVDEASILGALEHFYVPGPHTLIRGVNKLGAGERMIFETGKEPRVERWYRLSVAAANHANRADLPALDELLHDSVRRQMIADVPVGISLSGGIDSSVVAICAADSGLSNISAFTAFFEGHNEDELACSRLLAERFGLDLNIITWRPHHIEDEFARMVWFADEPVTDPAMYSAMKVSEAAASSVKVLLSGCGGDELFAGYNHHRLTQKQRLWLRSPGWLTGLPPFRTAAGLMGAQAKFRELECLRGTRYEYHRAAMSKLRPSDRSELAASSRLSRDPFAALCAAFEEAAHADTVNRQLFADTCTYLPDQLLTMLDRATMCASIEGRVPLLDHRLAEAAFAIPGNQKLGGGDNPKAILKRLAGGKLPQEVLDIRKRGFPAPVFEWIREELRPTVGAILTAEDSFTARFLPADWIRSLVATDESIHAGTSIIYSLLNLQVWHELFIKQGIDQPPDVPLHDLFSVSCAI